MIRHFGQTVNLLKTKNAFLTMKSMVEENHAQIQTKAAATMSVQELFAWASNLV